jgi:hypothetical protein
VLHFRAAAVRPARRDNAANCLAKRYPDCNWTPLDSQGSACCFKRHYHPCGTAVLGGKAAKCTAIAHPTTSQDSSVHQPCLQLSRLIIAYAQVFISTAGLLLSSRAENSSINLNFPGRMLSRFTVTAKAAEDCNHHPVFHQAGEFFLLTSWLQNTFLHSSTVSNIAIRNGSSDGQSQHSP